MRRRAMLRRAGVGITAVLAGCTGRGPTDEPADEGHTTGGDDTTTPPAGPRERREYHGRAMPLEGGFDCDGRTGTSVGLVFVTDDSKHLLTGDAAPALEDFESVSSRGECATVVGHVETPPRATDGDDCQFTFRSMPRLVTHEYRPRVDDCTL